MVDVNRTENASNWLVAFGSSTARHEGVMIGPTQSQGSATLCMFVPSSPFSVQADEVSGVAKRTLESM